MIEKKGKGIMNIFEHCPILENEKYQVRLIEPKDAVDLWKVYGDKLVLPFFNSDNCHGSNFYCSNLIDMENTIKYWLIEYHEYKGFVRFSILDKQENQVIGTIEMFKREAKDFFTNCGLLRLDLRRDYENQNCIEQILGLITVPFFTWFNCDKIATKAPIFAVERIEALKKAGYLKSEEILIGHDGKQYYDYWIIYKA